jgi:murein DD-endopeptidase MepM/ murein hydrolase activator NlpD
MPVVQKSTRSQGKSRRLIHRLLAVGIAISLATLSCNYPGYWVAPYSTPTEPAYEDLLSITVDAPPQPTPGIQTAPTVVPPGQSASTPDPALPEQTPTLPLVNTTPFLYYAQAADSLPVVAVRFGVSTTEITSPEAIPDTDFINPGQLLVIPRRLGNTTASTKVIPDSEVVFSPSTTDFNIHDYVAKAGGRLSTYSEWLKSTGTLTGAQVVLRVATENSINPRLLLALLEYQTGWVTGYPATENAETYPMGNVNLNQKGLYHQLVWAVNHLSVGYYAYREGRLTEIRFQDGTTARLAPDLNAGSAALQYFFAQIYSGQRWLDAIDPTIGLPAVHERLFGSPWLRAETVEPLFPAGLKQPPLTLPFARRWVWSLTGGPHGAWEHDGAYAALDFAPGSNEPGCVKSFAWVTAAAPGLVVRSGNGVVVIDLDGDGFEQTGWVLLYLHVSSEDRIPVGTWVAVDTPLGHASCEGGYATGTHLHFARKFNGEWIPADGPLPFNLDGWIAHNGPEAYKGSLTRDDKVITACT